MIPSEDPLIRLALLGKLSPENVVLLPQDRSVSQAAQAGKGFEHNFVT